MSDNKEKLQKFIAAVNDEVDARVGEILAEADSEKKRIISAAEEKGRREAEVYFEDKKRNAGMDFVREVSRAELEMKRDVLLHRDKLTRELFSGVEKRIAQYRSTPAYEKRLGDMLKEICTEDNAEIMLAPEDMKLAEKLGKQLGINASFRADQNIKLGGAAVLFRDRGIVVDRTFDLALEEQREKFASENVLTVS